MSAEPHYIAPSEAARMRRIEKRANEKAIELKRWLAANPLSTWHDNSVLRMRRSLDGNITVILVGGKELRTHTTGHQIPILPPSEPYPDSQNP